MPPRCQIGNGAPSERFGQTFEKMRPRILGALLDAVAHGLRALPTTRLDGLPRMADFALWATACEGALWPNGTFMAAYLENRTEAAEKLIETDVVATAVQALIAKRATWSGTATELDTRLRMAAGDGTKGWPALPQFLAARLRVLASSLGKTGIAVAFDKVGHDRKRVIALSRIGERPDPHEEKDTDASTLADGADAADAVDAARCTPADGADAADAVGEEVPNGELVEKPIICGVLIEDRRILVYQRRSRRHKLGLERPENLHADLYETDRRYDGDAGRICEAAITEGLEQIERTVPFSTTWALPDLK
jgi:hypothetical protein